MYVYLLSKDVSVLPDHQAEDVLFKVYVPIKLSVNPSEFSLI